MIKAGAVRALYLLPKNVILIVHTVTNIIKREAFYH